VYILTQNVGGILLARLGVAALMSVDKHSAKKQNTKGNTKEEDLRRGHQELGNFSPNLRPCLLIRRISYGQIKIFNGRDCDGKLRRNVGDILARSDISSNMVIRYRRCFSAWIVPVLLQSTYFLWFMTGSQRFYFGDWHRSVSRAKRIPRYINSKNNKIKNGFAPLLLHCIYNTINRRLWRNSITCWNRWRVAASRW
jgi:hypothetical protein